MRKPTGPAKIDTSPTLPGAPVQGVVALLFNFDFDDATVKPEHQAFLLEQFVPRLTAAAGLRVFLRGTASQVGNADYNLQLSRRRVEAVRNFLTGKGVGPAQIVTTFTGENLSTSKIADDERDRAVETIFEASTGPTQFERAFPGTNDGFDDQSNPRTLVVPLQTPRLLRIVGAVGAVVRSTNEGVVRVVDPLRAGANPVVATSDDFLIRLQPGVPGPAQVIARLPQGLAGLTDTARLVGTPGGPLQGGGAPGSGPDKARLIVRTLPRREQTVAFHYVKFSRERTPKEAERKGKKAPAPLGVRTQRQKSLRFEAIVLGVVNDIYIPQANISFNWANSREVDHNGVQEPHVDTTGARRDKRGITDMDLIFQTGDVDKHVRVFFVGRIGAETGDFGAVAPLGGSETLMQDRLRKEDEFTDSPDRVGQVLAHEIGHMFGELDGSGPTGSLMNGGLKIPLDMAIRMNAAAKKPPR